MRKLRKGWPEVLTALVRAADTGAPWLLVGGKCGLPSRAAAAFVRRGWATQREAQLTMAFCVTPTRFSARYRTERHVSITDAGRDALREHAARAGVGT